MCRWPCWFRTLLVLGGLLALPARAAAAGLDTAAIDKAVLQGLKAWQVPGAAIAIVHNDKIAYLKAYGVRELGSDKPVTARTLFGIASLTKAFTTTALAMLVEEGK